MKINTIGTTRIVIVLKNIVVKIPNFTFCWTNFVQGILANINENETWKYNSGQYESGKSHLLCPVKWCSWGGWILIMEKVDELITEDNCHSWDCSKHKECFGGDDTISNYGVLQGRLVKIDYANLDLYLEEDF